MNRVFLIRHAESDSNIGTVLEHQNSIKITPAGKKQAEELAEILEKPDKIICSRYIRTIETAEPLINKFSDAEINLWVDTHEFQPINPERYQNITTEERDSLHRKYWQNIDPLYNDGGEAESFKDFTIRVNLAILKMKQLQGLNYIFTHGHFIRCVITLLSYFKDYNSLDKTTDLYLKIMEKFEETYLSGELKIKNTEIFELTELLKGY
ncbi:MAG: phosphoglycerate mutase family protein [Patescibacteria group bacterium]